MTIVREGLLTLITRIFFSAECVLKCCFKWLLLMKGLGHWLQGCGFSIEYIPDCVLKCFFNLPLIEKDLSTLKAAIWFFTLVCSQVLHQIAIYWKKFGPWLQGYGFTPECILKCCFKWVLREKALGHWLQGYVLSPECFLNWFFKLLFTEKTLWHWLQGYCFSAECDLIWEKFLIQTAWKWLFFCVFLKGSLQKRSKLRTGPNLADPP